MNRHGNYARFLVGNAISTIVMFAIGFLAWATPAKFIGFSVADKAKLSALQQAIAATLPRTGRYIVPGMDDAASAILYRQGPIATVDYNVRGFDTVDPVTLSAGFAHYGLVSIMLALIFRIMVRHVPAFSDRLRIALGLTTTAAVLTLFSDPIYDHHDWKFAGYAFAVYLCMLWSASFILLRWFIKPTDQA